MTHDVLPVGPLACNCQILGDEASRRALVIDPGDDIADVERALSTRGLSVYKILFTHAHIDHIGKAAELKNATGAPTYLHNLELPVLDSLPQQATWLGIPPPEKVRIDNFLEPGDSIDLGDIELEVRFTPGHSPGSVSFYIPAEAKIIAGDTLFHDSIGRTDLPGGNAEVLLESIRSQILSLDDHIEVFPGHGPLTTVGREREHNFFLQSSIRSC